jgi:molybdate transport system substrate-binding protein
MRVRLFRAIAAIAALFVMSATISPLGAQERVTVFAAASLKNALDDVTAAWSEQRGKSANVSYAASSALAKQIEEGAPADLFISADLAWMDYLKERKLISPDSELKLLGNRIVLIAPAESGIILDIAPGFDLAAALGDGKLAMANVDSVPAGKYGKAALQSLGVWDKVSGSVAQAENVRAALALVSLGEAPLGIVYQTDAAADAGVKIVGVFPQNTHAPIIYPAAITAESSNADAADLLRFLQSQAAKDLFEKQGFEVLLPVVSN